MSRSKHTDPRPIRSHRRIQAPLAARAAGDPGRRRKLGRIRKEAGVAVNERPSPRHAGSPGLRIVVRRTGNGFHHPAGKRDVLELLNAVGPLAFYGLHAVELGRAPADDRAPSRTFGQYLAPGRIVLFEQPLPPWRLAGLPQGRLARRLERAGAVLTRLPEVGATLVDWPPGTLRRFMLEHVLLHELGHHVLQHYKGKRPERVARTRDHEAFARRFAQRQRDSLMARRES